SGNQIVVPELLQQPIDFGHRGLTIYRKLFGERLDDRIDIQTSGQALPDDCAGSIEPEVPLAAQVKQDGLFGQLSHHYALVDPVGRCPAHGSTPDGWPGRPGPISISCTVPGAAGSIQRSLATVGVVHSTYTSRPSANQAGEPSVPIRLVKEFTWCDCRLRA